MKRNMFKIIAIFLCLTLTGCSGGRLIKTKEADYSEGKNSANKKAVKVITLGELDTIKGKFLKITGDYLNIQSVEDYHKLSESIKTYCMAIQNSNIDNKESRLLDVQKSLTSNDWYYSDIDEDGVTDLAEIMITGTSPLNKYTESTDKQDGKSKYDCKYLLYNKDGEITVILPEIFPYFKKLMDGKDILISDGEYIIVNATVFAEEIKSINMTGSVQPRSIPELNSIQFPISFTLSGITATSITGNAVFNHKDQSGNTTANSVVYYVEEGKGSFDDYISRTKISSTTANKLFSNREYRLIFPKK